MTANTKIEWADHTFNPWTGCQAISPGCANCYAESWAKRAGRDFAQRRRTTDDNWRQPRKWNTLCEHQGIRQRVFCASLADVFDNDVDPEWRQALFELIKQTPNLDWLILTKRIGNAAAMIADAIKYLDIGYDPEYTIWPWPNVWLGATVVNQEEADRDIPKLLATPAALRFVSIEPMLGPISFTPIGARPRTAVHLNWLDQIDWVIAGGESGPRARPAHPDWFCSLRDQCAQMNVPFLFKQWGQWAPEASMPWSWQKAHIGEITETYIKWDGRMHTIADKVEYDASDVLMVSAGKSNTGRLLDGREYSQFPKSSV